MENKTNGDISTILARLLQRKDSDEAGERAESRVLTTRLIFIFDVKLSSTNLAPLTSYLAIMQGTLFTAKQSLVLLWKSKAISCLGRSFIVFSWRNGSTDFVKINIGLGDLVVEKVESAKRCLAEGEGKSFFLPATGVVMVEDFYLRTTGRPWIVSGEVHGRVQNNISNQHNIIADMRFVLGRIVKISEAAESSSSHIECGDRPRPRPVSSSSVNMRPSGGGGESRRALLSSVPDIKYPALTVSQALHCTRCKQCGQTFRFTIEYLYHFAIQTTCYSGPTEELYNRVSEDIVKNVEVSPHRLVCMKTVGQGGGDEELSE